MITKKAGEDMLNNEQFEEKTISRKEIYSGKIIDVAVDGKPLDLAMIKPFETLNIPLPAGVASKTLIWHSINDYGAISDAIKHPL